MRQAQAIDGVASDRKEVPGRVFDLRCKYRRTAADRRQKRYFVAFGQRSAGLGKTLVQSEHQTRRHFAQLRKFSGVMLEDGAEAAAIGDLYGVLSEADDVTQYTKKQDTDSHDL